MCEDLFRPTNRIECEQAIDRILQRGKKRGLKPEEAAELADLIAARRVFTGSLYDTEQTNFARINAYLRDQNRAMRVGEMADGLSAVTSSYSRRQIYYAGVRGAREGKISHMGHPPAFESRRYILTPEGWPGSSRKPDTLHQKK